MTVSDLRVLVENLDEYIHIPGGIERLKKTVLHLAISGQLVSQIESEGTGEDLYNQIQTEKAKLIAEGKIKKQKPLPEISDDEIPFDIPSSWIWVRLGEVSNYGSCEKVKSQQLKSETWVLELEDIEKESSVLLRKVYAKSRNSLSDKNVFTKGDVLYGKLRPYLDKVIIADDSGVCSSEILPIRIYGNNGIPSYLRFYLKSPYFVSTVNDLTYGVKMPRLGTDDGRKMVMPLPPLDEQKRIAERVEEIFSLIDELDKKYKSEEAERRKLVKSSLRALSHEGSRLALDNLTGIIKTKADAAELRKAILHLAVSGKLVPQIESEGTGEDLYKQIQTEKAKLIAEGKIKKQKPLPEISDDEIPFEIPSKWKWVRLGDISSYQQRGKSPKYAVTSNYPVISQKCVRTNHIDWSVAKYITPESIDKYENFRFLQECDLLLNSTGTGTMGRVGIYRDNPEYDKVVADSHVTVVRFTQQFTPEYGHIWLNSPHIQNDVESKASGSTNQIEWNLSAIQNELIPLPPLAEQKRIVQKTTELLELVSELEKQL